MTPNPNFSFRGNDTSNVHIMAWTTTPWTLPSNTALAVGKDIIYIKVSSFNPYSGEPVYHYIIAKELLNAMFRNQMQHLTWVIIKPAIKDPV